MRQKTQQVEKNYTIKEDSDLFRHKLKIGYERTCECKKTHINCMLAKEWLKSQLGVWQFFYEKRDIRKKEVHPATFPISLAKKVVELFTHESELVLDPFVGSGTTLVAAQDLNRNALGFDLQESYIEICKKRLINQNLFNKSKQIAIQDDALHISSYLDENTVSLIWTSPPYANLLNRKRKNKSRRDRKNEQYMKVEQYSQDDRDLGTMPLEKYTKAMGDIYEKLLPLLKPKGHCVINVPDMWWENQRITIHVSLIQELRNRGFVGKGSSPSMTTSGLSICGHF
ncbi:MAG: DNA methyltransferase [Candidatus Scalinduaceae bacterium]